MSVIRTVRAVALASGMAMTATPGFAALIEAQTLMQGFTNIVLGDLTATAETEGTVFVGGNFTSAANVNPDLLPDVSISPTVSGALIVGGSVYNSPKLQGGNAVIGGTSTVVNNGSGTVTSGVSGIPVAEVAKVLKDASLELATWASTPGGVAQTADQNNIRFDAVADANDIAVFNISGAALANGTFKGVFADPGVTVIINVSGTSVTVGLNGNETQSNTLFNFYEAATLNINTGFNYSMLAPLAAVRMQGGGTNGTVVSGSLTQMSEIRPTNFSGTFAFPEPPVSGVPLPGAGLLLAGGLGAVGLLRARRRAR